MRFFGFWFAFCTCLAVGGLYLFAELIIAGIHFLNRH